MSMNTEFDAWLRRLPPLGYEPDWIRRNLGDLFRLFESGVQMRPCPPPPEQRNPDRYGEL
jgi:hypothetical protein